MPSLSICIPTYNRCAMLAELLDSIVAQDRPLIEVVVADDASPDATAEVVARYRQWLPNLAFVRQGRNVGHEQNFLDVVARASGDYIWLLGDDDRVEPGGLDNVLQALMGWPGIGGLTVGVLDYDAGFGHPIGLRRMPQTQRFTSVEAAFGQLAELLGYMSALVIDRHAWIDVAREDPIASYRDGYMHVYIIGRVIERTGSWGCLDKLCVGFRADNDQFLSALGWEKRLALDVIAYDKLGRGLFPHNATAQHAMRARIFNTHVMARLRNAATNGSRTATNVAGVLQLLFRYYRSVPRFWLEALPTLLMPRPVLWLARRAYKRFSGSSGAVRARKRAQDRARDEAPSNSRLGVTGRASGGIDE